MSIFISYRRKDAGYVATEIYRELNRDYSIFLDTESLKNGFFDESIISQIESCSDFILIVTDDLFDRCSENDDWIDREVSTALRNEKNIIPIFVGVDGFSHKNIPNKLQDVCRYNGIAWKEKDDFYIKLRSFLVSNKRYVLSVIRSGLQAALSNESKEELKKLYQKTDFRKHGPIEIQIEISDLNDLAECAVREDIVADFGLISAQQFAEQSVRRSFSNNKKVIETAVEYMIQDEVLSANASWLSSYYIERYGIENCYFSDECGVDRFYWIPFLWIDIIEELLKEIVDDRYFDYANSENFLPIDCYAENRNGKQIWSFVSFLKKQPYNKDYDKFIEAYKSTFGHADYFDIPKYDLLLHVYPDFYFNIGLLKTNNTCYSFDAINKYKGIFELTNYFFGLH